MAAMFCLREPDGASVETSAGGSVCINWNGKLGAQLAQILDTAQRRLDTEVLQACAPYIPKDTGALIASGEARDGEVAWGASYAAAQYYNTAPSLPGAPLRGGRWFERMMADQGDALIKKTTWKGGVR